MPITTTKTITGRFNISRGEYAPGTTYYRMNLVQCLGSTYECLTDGTTVAPATVDTLGNVTVDVNWKPWADASVAHKLGNNVEAMSAEINGLAAGIGEADSFRQLPLLCGQPMILFGHGAPAKGVVPDNWRQFNPATGEGYDWNGQPSALGQQYLNVDVTPGGLYIAVRDTKENGLKWLNC